MDIYQQNILDHYKNPHNYGRIKDPTNTTKKSNPSCGDKVVIDVVVEDGKIKDVKFEGSGCAISVAGASLLTDKIKGMKVHDVKKMTFEDMTNFLGVSVSPGRVKCVMLGLESIKSIL